MYVAIHKFIQSVEVEYWSTQNDNGTEKIVAHRIALVQ